MAQLHRIGTATSPGTQLRVRRGLGASASALGLEGAAGYLHLALGAARSLNGMRAPSPCDRAGAALQDGQVCTPQLRITLTGDRAETACTTPATTSWPVTRVQ